MLPLCFEKTQEKPRLNFLVSIFITSIKVLREAPDYFRCFLTSTFTASPGDRAISLNWTDKMSKSVRTSSSITNYTVDSSFKIHDLIDPFRKASPSADNAETRRFHLHTHSSPCAWWDQRKTHTHSNSQIPTLRASSRRVFRISFSRLR